MSASRMAPLPVIAAVVLLGAAAIGLHPAIAGLTAYFSKKPIELRVPLEEFDVSLMEGYVALPEGKGFQRPKDDDDSKSKFFVGMARVDEAGNRRPEPPVGIYVTYYSDPRDQVPHTPEVCYRLSGALVSTMTTLPLTIEGPEPKTIDVRVLDVTSNGLRRLVAYVICCNGEFYFDREQVRFAIGFPGDKHIYFSKVEVASGVLEDEPLETSHKRALDALGEVIPILAEHYWPTDAAVRDGFSTE